MNELELHQRIDTLEGMLENVLAQLEAMQPTKSLTVGTSEVASMLGCSTRTILREHHAGKLPKTVSKLDSNLKWNRVDIEREAESRKRGGRPRKAA